MRLLFIYFFSILLYPTSVTAATKVYFGNLHAHSNLSDGYHTITPEAAYQHARNSGDLDFMSLSEHNHMISVQDMQKLQQASKAETKSGFVALFGQEYSYITTGFNHANIHNYPYKINKSDNGKYKKVFTKNLSYMQENPSEIVFGGFNHPKALDNDYGIRDFGGNWEMFVETLDPVIQMIAIGSGPADSGNKNFTISDITPHEHRDVGTKRWFEYLARGMHLAPKIDHDTHSLTYGERVSGRTAVWIDGSLTKDKLLNALASRHVYVTEDLNIEVFAKVDELYLPGDIINRSNSDPISVKVKIVDPDEGGSYKLDIYSGVSGSMGQTKQVGSLQTTLNESAEKEILLPLDAGIPTYFVLKIQQTSNDPVNGSAKDDVWLAPIFVEWPDNDVIESVPVYVGSKNSNIYHLADCSVVNRIKPSNLVEYSTAPNDKSLHENCPL